MRITEIPRSEIVVYCRHGLISPLEGPPEDEWHFDATAVHALRRLAYLRTQFALNRTGPRLSSALLREIEPLRSELRFCGDGRRCVAVRCKPPKRPLIGSPPQSLARLSHWSPFSRQGYAGLHPFASAALWRRMVVGDGFEPSKALAGGFTVRPRWPLE